ncbi:MAG: ATP-binding protein [Pyrinomonadaceae bacterium]|nr:ATP-binding protein [Pyrinomonadaceae bacterium]
MFYKPLNEVDLNDLQLLVSNKVQEGTQLDYKLTEPEKNDDGKKEFLKDVSAFANTNGGYLIYGVEEQEINKKKTGFAERVVGIEGLNTNDLKLWMENLIRTNIEPRLVGIEFKEIIVSLTHTVLIVRIPRSWNSPHVVSFGKHWRFYARNSAGNYQMDVTQLRDLFNLGNTIPEKIEEKRNGRLSEIKRKYQTGKQIPLATLVIQIYPFDSLRMGTSIDLSKAKVLNKFLSLGDKSNYDPKFNFDGLYFGENNSYMQIFRNGVIEELNTRIFGKDESGEYFLNSKYLDWDLIKSVGWRLALLKFLGIDSPIMLNISVLGIHNYKIKVRYAQMNQYFDKILSNKSDRSDLIINPIFIESVSNLDLEGSIIEKNTEILNCWKTAENLLKPAFDSIWNAFGFEKCLYYDDEGIRIGYIKEYDRLLHI